MKNIAHYYYNGFEENIYIYIYKYIYIYIYIDKYTFLYKYIHRYRLFLSCKRKRYFFEIFEYGSMYLKTDHLKLGVSIDTYFLRLNDNLWLYKRLFYSPSASLRFSLCNSKSLLSVMVLYVTFVNYIISLTVPFHWTFYFFSAIYFLVFGHVVSK